MTDPKIASFTRADGAPYFVFCDHASNAIPPELNSLGIPGDILQTHIAWDIGAGALASALGQALSGATFNCDFSRLVIDPNRAVEATDLIPAVSDQIPIPGNQMVSAADRQARIDKFHTPYHAQLAAALDAMGAAHNHFMAISVHSFTNRLMGAADDRPWPVGLLWRDDETHARAMMDYLGRTTGWPIGDNEPYDARVFNYTIDRHIGPKGIAHLTIEIRQNMIESDKGVNEIAGILAAGVREISKARAAASVR